VNEKLELVRKSHIKSGEVNKGYCFNNNGWEVEISFIKKSVLVDRPLGSVHNGQAKVIDSQKPLRQSLDQKRGGKYGDFSEPFIIAVNSTDITLEKSEIISILYGSYSEDTIQLDQKVKNSFFQADGIPHNKRVSGVLIAHNFLPWNLHVASIEFWHNPWSVYPLKKDVLSIDEFYYVEKRENFFQLNYKLGRRVCDLLMIDSNKMKIKDDQ
jgi:hypothetical protein